MQREIIHPASVHSTAGVGYSHVARVGPICYIAGQIALDVNGALVGEGDITRQARQVFTNLLAILDELGGSAEHLVKLTTYLTRREDLAGFRAVRNAMLAEPFPPNTLLFIQGLADPRYLIEIEAVAHL